MTLFDFDSLAVEPGGSGSDGSAGAGGPGRPGGTGDGDDGGDGRRRRSRLFRASLVFVIVVAILVPGGFIAYGIFHQRITDQLAVWQYQPTAEISQMVIDSGMNGEGRFYFYASEPTVENAADFTAVCGSSTDDFVLLGCYNGTSIHVFNVTDARLSGIRNVTAAHEMLHAVYARLSDDARTTLDAELEAQYATEKDNPELAARMQSYATSEPGERDNELHSIFGTEVGTLSPELEAHYAAYFTDRTKVVALNASFQAVFDEVQAQETSLAAELTASGDTIDSESTKYQSDMAQLNDDIAAFNAKADAGDFATQRSFNAARDALTARTDTLTTTYDTIQSDIAHYNDLRTQLQALDSQADELNRSIDSTVQAPAPTPAPTAG